MSSHEASRIGLQPQGTELFLDHIAHWVPDADAAAEALRAMGFNLTPFSEQHQNDASGKLIPAGAGNRCVMLEQGYLEFLTPLADTPIGAELEAGISRYTGVHIGAFACADTQAGYAHMREVGIDMRPLAHLERQVQANDGTQATARFTVARPQPGQVAEGRVQLLTHHTPELLWQRRYVEHGNGVSALAGLVLGVTSVEEASARYRRLFQRQTISRPVGHTMRTEQGTLYLVTEQNARALLGDAPVPTAPCMVSYVLRCTNIEAFLSAALSGGAALASRARGAAVVRLPQALGASIIAVEQDGDVLELLR
jgi:hypothetical protein